MARVHSSDPWPAGSFGRDTVIYAFGVLGEAVLHRAYTDRVLWSRYEQWLSRGNHDEAEPLVCTGIDGGTATLLARPRGGEFCLDVEHPKFKALVALGLDARSPDLRGVLVAQFEGDLVIASAFALALARTVRERPDTHSRSNHLSLVGPYASNGTTQPE